MTVGELIEQLKQYPDSRLVLVDGYETGFDTPRELVVYTVRERPDARRLAPHDGHYELRDFTYEDAVEAVAIETRRG